MDVRKNPKTQMETSSVLVLFLVAIVTNVAFARGNPRRHQLPANCQPIVNLASSSARSSSGHSTAETRPSTERGRAFSWATAIPLPRMFLNLHGQLFVYWEPNLTATQIEAGAADSFLKNWATQMKAYGQPIIFAPLDEMNGNWSAYYGNPTAFKAAWIRIHSLFSGDSNVKFAYDPNVEFPGTPVSTFVDYYPGSAYVDIVGLDGFDFGGPDIFASL